MSSGFDQNTKHIQTRGSQAFEDLSHLVIHLQKVEENPEELLELACFYTASIPRKMLTSHFICLHSLMHCGRIQE